MYKIVFLFILTSCFLNGNILDTKVKNIVGSKEYQIHNRLIKNIFNNENQFIISERINYLKVFKVLRENGLLNLRLNKPQNIEVTFEMNSDNIMSYKILLNTIQSLGYRHVITKSLQLDSNNLLRWTMSIKTEYMLDTYLLIKELQKNNGIVKDIVQTDKQHWQYFIDFKNAKVATAKKIPSFERVVFNKPLRPIFVSINNGKTLSIISRVLNRWYPYIVFYDKNLNILKSYKKDSAIKKMGIDIPAGCRYIMVKDMYNLVNIKRGLTLIVR